MTEGQDGALLNWLTIVSRLCREENKIRTRVIDWENMEGERD